MNVSRSPLSVFFRAGVFVMSVACCAAAAAAGYVQDNLVSNIPGLAANTDPNLKNPWGVTSGPATPFWVSDNVTGVQTLYNTTGTPQALVVTIPNGGPTGNIFNPTTDFPVTPGTPSRFIFSNLHGDISAWAAGNVATVEAHATGAYTGLTMDNVGSANMLYAANFATGNVDVYSSTFVPVTIPGGFIDPNLPANFAPFNIQNINGNLYVMYAEHGAPVTFGSGLGFIDVFNASGMLLNRLVTGGQLNAPWGIAMAPATFGQFANALLIGNEGDGRINAFNPATGAFLGTLTDPNGNPIVNERLWGLRFGNGGNGGDPNLLYLAAGIHAEQDGLFASLRPAVPEPASFALFAAGVAAIGWRRRRRA